MRLAVLITNYGIAGLLLLALLSTTDSEDPGTTILGLILMTPPVILSIIYAHKTKEDK